MVRRNVDRNERPGDFHSIKPNIAFAHFLIQLLAIALLSGFFLLITPLDLRAGEDDSPPVEAGNSYHPLIVKLNEDGSRYIRFITWHQFWVEGSRHLDADDAIDFAFTLRRSRLLIMGQVSPRFLLVTHFGVNSLTAGNMDAAERSTGPAFFIQDAWAEFAIKENFISAGAGLHSWNGISRLTNQATASMLTIDVPRFSWPSTGTTGQNAGHLGIYLKGQAGRFDYRASVNQPIRNTLDMKEGVEPGQAQAVYINDGKFLYNGYVMHQFLDLESNKLPYLTGTYLGEKRILNIGAGFQYHPRGSRYLEGEDSLQYNVRLFGADIFADFPFGSRVSQAFTGYFVYYRFDFGPNYKLSGTSDLVATGNIFYGQAGYLLPEFTDKGRLQVYMAASVRDLNAYRSLGNTVTAGANWFILGHSAKISLEYNSNQDAGGGERKGLVRLQAAVML